MLFVLEDALFWGAARTLHSLKFLKGTVKMEALEAVSWERGRRNLISYLNGELSNLIMTVLCSLNLIHVPSSNI
jgi:hypothetical protein